jgi:hypothetical protein
VVTPVFIDEGLSFFTRCEALLKPSTATLNLSLCRWPIGINTRNVSNGNSVVLRLPELRGELVAAFDEGLCFGKGVELLVSSIVSTIVCVRYGRTYIQPSCP